MKLKLLVVMTLLLALILSACSTGTASEVQVNAAATDVPMITTITTVEQSVTANSETTAEVLSMSETHDDPQDVIWDTASVVSIVFNGSDVAEASDAVKVDGTTITITRAGVYSLSGLLTDGQVIVNTDDEEPVKIVLDDVTINNTSSAPIHIVKAEKTVIILADNTKNYLSDASEYVYSQADQDEPNAALFSASDLTIAGSGLLTVNGNYKDGITSKDGLVIANGTIVVNAVDDGIRGKDYILVKSGEVTVTAGGDGLKADNEEDTSKGFVTIEGGQFNFSAGSDGITAQTSVLIVDGDFTIKSGSAEMDFTDESSSAKGIKAAGSLQIENGLFVITAVDDALHTNGSFVINGGTFEIESGDDGMHADTELTINSGEINITGSYEGIESAVITFNGGNISVTASDDGINVAGGVDGSGMMGFAGRQSMPGGQPASMPGGVLPNNPTGARPDAFTANNSYYLYINGGSIEVDALGDGLDINGAIKMTGGQVIVNGPTEQMNGALDYDGGFEITGGLLVAVGSTGMAQAPDAQSSQNSVLVNLTAVQQAGTAFNIRSSSGKDLLTITPTRDYQSVAFSSPDLVSTESFTIYLGGSVSGTAQAGLYEGGSYTPGTQYEQFTVTDVVTMIGTTGRGGMRRP